LKEANCSLAADAVAMEKVT